MTLMCHAQSQAHLGTQGATHNGFEVAPAGRSLASPLPFLPPASVWHPAPVGTWKTTTQD